MRKLFSISDRSSKWIAFLLTCAIHAAIFAVKLPEKIQEIDLSKQIYRIPVEIQITQLKPPPKKPVEPVRKKVVTPVAKKPQARASVEAPKPKPTSLPGDRKEPEVIEQVMPVYPKMALNEELSGEIKLLVTISPDGRAVSFNITQSTGHEVLDKAFIRTVRESYSFKPKRVMGENKESQIRLSYKFELD